MTGSGCAVFMERTIEQPVPPPPPTQAAAGEAVASPSKAAKRQKLCVNTGFVLEAGQADVEQDEGAAPPPPPEGEPPEPPRDATRMVTGGSCPVVEGAILHVGAGASVLPPPPSPPLAQKDVRQGQPGREGKTSRSEKKKMARDAQKNLITKLDCLLPVRESHPEPAKCVGHRALGQTGRSLLNILEDSAAIIRDIRSRPAVLGGVEDANRLPAESSSVLGVVTTSAPQAPAVTASAALGLAGEATGYLTQGHAAGAAAVAPPAPEAEHAVVNSADVPEEGAGVPELEPKVPEVGEHGFGGVRAGGSSQPCHELQPTAGREQGAGGIKVENGVLKEAILGSRYSKRVYTRPLSTLLPRHTYQST